MKSLNVVLANSVFWPEIYMCHRAPHLLQRVWSIKLPPAKIRSFIRISMFPLFLATQQRWKHLRTCTPCPNNLSVNDCVMIFKIRFWQNDLKHIFFGTWQNASKSHTYASWTYASWIYYYHSQLPYASLQWSSTGNSSFLTTQQSRNEMGGYWGTGRY